MKKKNYKNKNYANRRKTYQKQNVYNKSNLYSNNLLNRVLLVKGDLEHLDKAINELRIYQILDPNVLKENVQFIVKSIAKDCNSYTREIFYHKLFKERVPIYKEEVQLQNIIEDSITLVNVLSVAWKEEKKEFIAQWLLFLYDNIQKIKIIISALEGIINQINEQLDFYFQVKSQVEMLITYIEEILKEYNDKNNLHLKCIS